MSRARKKDLAVASTETVEKSNTELVDPFTKKDDVKKTFNKKFGEGTFFTFADEATAKVMPIPFGIPSLDFASGIGGLPGGRIVEIYGPESSGKTTVSLYVLREAQRLARIPGHPLYGRRVGFIDAEHALDPSHVQAIGVDCNEISGMLINQPDSGEEAYDLMEAMALSDQFSVVVVDSIAALVPMKEAENGMDYNPIGLQARMNSQGLRKLKGVAYKHNTLFIFINQLRMKVGVMHGNPETTPGGQALKFYASVRLDVRRKEIKKGDVFLGQTMTIKFKKNKVFRPFTQAEFDYYWIGGVDLLKDIMEVAIETDVIKRAGAYYFLGPDKDNPYKDGDGNELKWQGKETLLEVLRLSPGLFGYVNDMVQGNIPKDAQFVTEDNSQDGSEEGLNQELQGIAPSLDPDESHTLV